jgi:phosphate transport system substrate-binding protein
MKNLPNSFLRCVSLRLLALIGLLMSPLLVSAQSPVTQNRENPPQVLRVWGANDSGGSEDPLLAVLIKIEQAFNQSHPAVHFQNQLHGNGSALGALYIGAADIAVMTRPPLYFELDGYQQAIAGQTPLQTPFMRGSAAPAGAIPPLVLIVSLTNPTRALSFQQVKDLFNCSHRGGANGEHDNSRFGTTGNQQVHLLGFATDSDESIVLRDELNDQNARWPCDYLAFPNGKRGARLIVERVSGDSNAIGVTTLDAVTSDVRVLGIADQAGNVVYPTAETVAAGAYPLARTAVAETRRASGDRSDLAVSAFLDFLVGPEAASIIRLDGRFAPLLKTATHETSGAIQ